MKHATVMTQRTNVMHLMVTKPNLSIYHGIMRSIIICVGCSFLTEDSILILSLNSPY